MLVRKTTTEIRTCITHFLYISFPFLHAYHVLMPNFAFFCTASTSNYEILFPLLIFDMVNWNSTSGEFAFIWQSKRVGIIAIKTGRTQIYFRNDVLVDVASWLRARRIGERVKASSTTGNPGSVIVPQYGSSKITVFVWGKNIILKFLGNTK